MFVLILKWSSASSKRPLTPRETGSCWAARVLYRQKKRKDANFQRQGVSQYSPHFPGPFQCFVTTFYYYQGEERRGNCSTMTPSPLPGRMWKSKNKHRKGAMTVVLPVRLVFWALKSARSLLCQTPAFPNIASAVATNWLNTHAIFIHRETADPEIRESIKV